VPVLTRIKSAGCGGPQTGKRGEWRRSASLRHGGALTRSQRGADDGPVEDESAVLSDASVRRWNQRASAVIGAAFSSLAVPVTGLLDHAAGREWAIAHTALGVLCLAFCICHVVLNRRALLSYVTRASAGRWNQRTVVVAGAALCGLTLPVTGLLDHFAGREWALPHAATGVLCVGFCVWHAVLNRSALVRYARSRMPAYGLPARELIAATVLTGAVLAATVIHALEA